MVWPEGQVEDSRSDQNRQSAGRFSGPSPVPRAAAAGKRPISLRYVCRHMGDVGQRAAGCRPAGRGQIMEQRVRLPAPRDLQRTRHHADD